LTEVDDTVKDGIGEICNMLAGAWKGKVPDLAANCGLSVPAVITGRDYNLHVQAPEFKLHHTTISTTPASKSPSSAMACSKAGNREWSLGNRLDRAPLFPRLTPMLLFPSNP
jgi:hypothetical protein